MGSGMGMEAELALGRCSAPGESQKSNFGSGQPAMARTHPARVHVCGNSGSPGQNRCGRANTGKANSLYLPRIAARLLWKFVLLQNYFKLPFV